MFDAITIRGSDSYGHNSIDPGILAESLLFYQTVHLVLDGSNLGQLVQKIGIDNFRHLLNNRLCTATYFTDLLGTKADTLMGSEALLYNFVAPQLHKRSDQTKPLRGRDLIVDTLTRTKDLNIPKGKIERLSERMAVKNNSDLIIGNKSMLESARADLDDSAYHCPHL